MVLKVVRIDSLVISDQLVSNRDTTHRTKRMIDTTRSTGNRNQSGDHLNAILWRAKCITLTACVGASSVGRFLLKTESPVPLTVV